MTKQESLKRSCKACGMEYKLHEHHIIPQFMESRNQKRIIMCQKDHQIFHNMLNQTIWKNRLVSQEVLEEKIEAFTKWFCKHKWKITHPENKRDFLSNHCILCQKECRFAWWDYEDSMGLFGLCKDCNDWEERENQFVKDSKKEEIRDTTNDWKIKKEAIKIDL